MLNETIKVKNAYVPSFYFKKFKDTALAKNFKIKRTLHDNW